MRTGRRLLVTTTSSLDGWSVTEYLGPVSAQFVIGTGLFADFFSTWTDFFGAHSRSYQKKLDRINQEALDLITEKALKLGANAVLGLRVDHDEISGTGKSMLMVTASGTAAKAKEAATKTPDTASSPGAITGYELRMLLERQSTLSRAQAGDLNWADEKTWRFIIDNQVEEVAFSFLDYAQDGVVQTAYAPEARKELRQRFEEYFLSIPVEAARTHLYTCLGKDEVLYGFAFGLIRQLEAFDADLILDILNGKDEVAARRALYLVVTDQPVYGKADIPQLESLLDVIRKRFKPKDTYETKGLFGKKLVWLCECQREIEAGTTRCSSCARDRWGFEKNLLNPEQAARVLSDKIELLKKQFEAVPPSS